MTDNDIVEAARQNVREKEILVEMLLEKMFQLECENKDLREQVENWTLLWQNRK